MGKGPLVIMVSHMMIYVLCTQVAFHVRIDATFQFLISRSPLQQFLFFYCEAMKLH